MTISELLEHSGRESLPRDEELPIVVAMLRVQVERLDHRIMVAEANCDAATRQSDLYAQRAAAAEARALQLHATIDAMKSELADAMSRPASTSGVDERSAHRPSR
jgi:hypothetical protein